MRFLRLIVVWLSFPSLIICDHTQQSVNQEKETNTRSTDGMSPFLKNSFTPCGEIIPKTDPNFTLFYAYTVSAGERFAPGRRSDKDAKCTLLISHGTPKNTGTLPNISEVLGRTGESEDDKYTVIPGRILGHPYKEKINYMILPNEGNKDWKKPPVLIPGPCDTQKPGYEMGFAMKNGPEDPDKTSFISLNYLQRPKTTSTKPETQQPALNSGLSEGEQL